jgi:hypothetical protein
MSSLHFNNVLPSTNVFVFSIGGDCDREEDLELDDLGCDWILLYSNIILPSKKSFPQDCFCEGDKMDKSPSLVFDDRNLPPDGAVVFQASINGDGLTRRQCIKIVGGKKYKCTSLV